ncbi:MAG: glycosyltransferase family 2 protein [Candidatus Omnitrophica bacterium]|jgi:glycosyltransferase involved in cell wall biosynthesis|nr:glycosyltransferase family 2 protein [Candidatus Omnitrophota bacterium]
MECPFVSVIMACRNERDYIAKSLTSLLKTTYPLDKLEIIVIDGESTDGTREALEEMASKNNIVKVLTNSKKIIPAALNIGIKNSQGEIIIRADAHAEFSSDYISKCVEYLHKTDAWCVGGTLETASLADTLIAKAIVAVLSSPFGVGFSYFRIGKEPRYTDTVPFGAFRKEVFNKIGLYDECLVRNEDNEFSSRIIKNKGKIFITPEIKSTYYARTNLKSFLENSYANGLWNAFIQRFYPYAFRWRHFLPLVFFMGCVLVFISLILGVILKATYLYSVSLILVPYFLVNILSSLTFIKKLKMRSFILTIGLYFLFHFVYGYGILKGWMLVLRNLRPQE